MLLELHTKLRPPAAGQLRSQHGGLLLQCLQGRGGLVALWRRCLARHITLVAGMLLAVQALSRGVPAVYGTPGRRAGWGHGGCAAMLAVLLRPGGCCAKALHCIAFLHRALLQSMRQYHSMITSRVGFHAPLQVAVILDAMDVHGFIEEQQFRDIVEAERINSKDQVAKLWRHPHRARWVKV